MDRVMISQLIDEGNLDYSFVGSGEATGYIGDLTLTNKTPTEYEVFIPKGTIFVSPEVAVQDMGTASPHVIPLPGNSSRSIRIDDGFCADDYSKPPPSQSSSPSTPRKGGIVVSKPHEDVINTVERLLSEERCNATRLMRATKARQTLIQWSIWVLANPATFNKEKARAIVYSQFKKKGKNPDNLQVNAGVDMLFDDIELAVKETPSAPMAIPVVTADKEEEFVCDCHGQVNPTSSHTGPEILISEEYKDEDERTAIIEQMRSDLESGAIKITPSTLIAYANDAAVAGYGDARAAYKFLDKPGNMFSGEWIGRTEHLDARVFGSSGANIWVRKHRCKECSYKSVVGAAAISIVGADAIIFDPLENTEEGFRFLENMYEFSTEFIKQDWLTEIFDFIRDNTTHYFIDTSCNSSIETHIGSSSGSCAIDVNAKLDRTGSEANVRNLKDEKLDWSLVSNCVAGEHLQIRIDGTTNLSIEAEDGGLGLIGQDSMIGYVWYWACEATDKDGNVVVTGDSGYDWRFTKTGDKVTPEDLSTPERVTQDEMGTILTETIGEVFNNDPLNCELVKPALEQAITLWIGELASKANAFTKVAEQLQNK